MRSFRAATAARRRRRRRPTPAAKALTAAQQARLKDGERHAADVEKHRAAGKLAEAIAACAKKLAIERQVYGNVHDQVADTLGQLAELHEDTEDFATARTA